MDISDKISKQLFGYVIKRLDLLEQALIHTSYANETGLDIDNERLEFLGDAVLELIVSEYLYQRFPEAPEGELARLRAAIVCAPTLARWARKWKLGGFLQLGVGEEKSGGRDRDSILSDAIEAVIGAHYLSEGYAATRDLVAEPLRREVDSVVSKGYIDPKSRLQEALQVGGISPEYVVVEESGPDHAKTFSVEVFWAGKVRGRGRGRSKKEAQRRAAEDALGDLEG